MSALKNVLITLSILLILAGCSVKHYTIGMSESEFKNSEKYNIELVEETSQHTVYRRVASADAQMKPLSYHYYYFNSGTLVRTELVETPKPGIVLLSK
ncbi:hypothetical protein MTO98_24190 [Mucilaginibacter sp. SMC90]|uniref:hypothetical protein n=1 Tax=Mucilaginibacter sp. SMC90 TaxID=2929803 RepID=UPI001FB3312B|nr:hypothetical protein [Mucilaginibacter sp. SMC90]UOE47513.1 hypothetical protein MTO98_24190 [Mucilaginibacter sp. SMC90]